MDIYDAANLCGGFVVFGEGGIDVNDTNLIDSTIVKTAYPDAVKPDYYNGRAIVANKSHHINILNNIIRDVPSAAIRAQRSDYVNISGNQVYRNTYWTTQGVGAITVSEAEVRPPGDTCTDVKITLSQNQVYQNENKLVSWNPTKAFVAYVIDEARPCASAWTDGGRPASSCATRRDWPAWPPGAK